MSFLDNLENSLKSLESQDDKSSFESDRKRQQQKAESIAAAPWADKLKKSAYVATLLTESVAAGRQLRSKIYLAWLENTLRLEARGNFCELVPTAQGIRANYRRISDNSHQSEDVNLNDDPKALLERWLF